MCLILLVSECAFSSVLKPGVGRFGISYWERNFSNYAHIFGEAIYNQTQIIIPSLEFIVASDDFSMSERDEAALKLRLNYENQLLFMQSDKRYMTSFIYEQGIFNKISIGVKASTANYTDLYSRQGKKYNNYEFFTNLQLYPWGNNNVEENRDVSHSSQQKNFATKLRDALRIKKGWDVVLTPSIEIFQNYKIVHLELKTQKIISKNQYFTLYGEYICNYGQYFGYEQYYFNVQRNVRQNIWTNTSGSKVDFCNGTSLAYSYTTKEIEPRYYKNFTNSFSREQISISHTIKNYTFIMDLYKDTLHRPVHIKYAKGWQLSFFVEI